jgi:hypothetical protein
MNKIFHFQKIFQKFSAKPLAGRRRMCGGNHRREHRTQRRFCSDGCKYDYHALKRVKALRDRVGKAEFSGRWMV